MSERAPYSRVYWSIRDDEKFDKIRGDDHHLATWLRLLIAADMAYPASADLPASARRASVKALVEAGLVDLVSDGMFRLRGLTAERERRKAAATSRGPNGTQTVPVRSANGDLDETRRDETSTSRDETPRDAADIYWQLTGKFPTGRALDWIDNLASNYGAEATVGALVKTHITNPSVNDLLSRTQDVLRAEARKLDLKEREAEAARLAEKRAKPRVEEQWRAEYREAQQRYYAEKGAA